MFNNIGSKTLALCLGTLAVVFSISYLVLAWTEPTSPPSASVGNIPLPINVGTTTQFKEGDLKVKGDFFALGGAPSETLVVVNGKVGVGTTTPVNNLEVKGTLFLTEDICLANGICLGSCSSTSCSGECVQYQAGFGCKPKVGEYGFPACSGCLGGYTPEYYDFGIQDGVGSNRCGSPLPSHYRCDGAGNCIASTTQACIVGLAGKNCNNICTSTWNGKDCVTGWASSTNCGQTFLPGGGGTMSCDQTTRGIDSCRCNRYRWQ